MRSEADIMKCKGIIASHYAKAKDPFQKTLLGGMVNALGWVCETSGSTVERLFQGEQIDTPAYPGQTEEIVKRRIK